MANMDVNMDVQPGVPGGVPAPERPVMTAQEVQNGPTEQTVRDVPPTTPIPNRFLIVNPGVTTNDFLSNMLVTHLSNPIVNGPPLAVEVLSEEGFEGVQVRPHHDDRTHVRTDSKGKYVPCGVVRFQDAAAGMACPSTFLGPCVVRGFGGGKIMLSRMLDREVEPQADVRHVYLVNSYLSYVQHGEGSVDDTFPLRDVVFVPKEDEKTLVPLLLSLARLGHGPVLQPVVVSVQPWSNGRTEVLVRTPSYNVQMGANGHVHSCLLGAAGVTNVHQNRVHDSVRQSMSVMGSAQTAVSLSMERLRTSLLIFGTVLRFAANANMSRCLIELQAQGAVYDEQLVQTEDQARAYSLSVLILISGTVDFMECWRSAPRIVLTEQKVFNRVMSIMAPLMTATLSFDNHTTVDEACPMLGGVLLPFTAVSSQGVHMSGPWPKTKEDVVVEWTVSVLFRLNDYLMSRFGSDYVQTHQVVKKTVDVLVPAFEPSAQATFLSLLTERPGNNGGLSYGVEGSSLHLYLSKKEVSSWSQDKVRQYQIPFHALSAWNGVWLKANMAEEVLVRDEENAVHVSYDLKSKMSAVPSFSEAMSEVVTTEVTDVLYGHCRDNNVIVDSHLELVTVPDIFWGRNFLSCTFEERAVLTFLFRKRLADVVAGWKQSDPRGAWNADFVQYK